MFYKLVYFCAVRLFPDARATGEQSVLLLNMNFRKHGSHTAASSTAADNLAPFFNLLNHNFAISFSSSTELLPHVCWMVSV